MTVLVNVCRISIFDCRLGSRIFEKRGLQILIDHAYFSQRICIVIEVKMAQASYSLTKVNDNNYDNISLAMCHVINSLNHQSCLTEPNCIMPILLLNKC